MEIQKSKVYVLLDERSRILRCEGGYTMSNIDDVSKWTYVDEGTGDRYNLCQSHYLPHPLLTHDGLYRYRLADGQIVERSEEELEEERAGLPRPEVQPTETEQLRADVDFLAAMAGVTL